MSGIVTQAEFPHGIRCLDCNRPLDVGDPYATLDLGTDTNELVCISCAASASLLGRPRGDAS